MLFAQTCIVLLLVPAMSATIIVKEYELENMDMLHMTLLRPREILLGKLKAAWYGMLPLLIAILIANIPILIFSMVPIVFGDLPISYRSSYNLGLFSAWVSGITSMLLSVAFAILLSVFASLFCKRSITALLSAYGLCAFGMGGFIFIAAVAWEMLRHTFGLPNFGSEGDFSFQVFAYISPLVGQLLNMSRYQSHTNLNYINAQWLASQAYSIFIAALLLWASIRVFQRKLKRNAQ